MRGISQLVTAGLVATIAIAPVSAPVSAMDVDEVIAKHIAARGGDHWRKIDTIKVTGSYTAFSETHDFTLQRKRGNRE